MGKNLMDDAKIVPQSAAPADDGSDPGDTLLTGRTKSKRTLFVLLLLAVPIVVIAGIWVASRFGGGDASAAAAAPPAAETEAKAKPETAAETSAVWATQGLPSVCTTDLTHAAEWTQWYCAFMPWKVAVDAELGRLKTQVAQLKERGSDGGVPTSVWILIGALAANGVVTWILLLRRRRPLA